MSHVVRLNFHSQTHVITFLRYEENRVTHHFSLYLRNGSRKLGNEKSNVHHVTGIEAF